MAEDELRQQIEVAMRANDFTIRRMADAAWVVVSPVVAKRDALRAELAEARAAIERAKSKHRTPAERDDPTHPLCSCGLHSPCPTRRALDASQRPEDTIERPKHIGGGANAEDCPACHGTNPPYPFICPGEPESPDGDQ